MFRLEWRRVPRQRDRLLMRKHLSPIQSNYPVPEDFIELAKRWSPDAIDVLLGYVWDGYDELKKEFDVKREDKKIEDDITLSLFCRIQDTKSPFSPFNVIHQPPEIEWQAEVGQSPKSDLGFRLRGGNVRSHFSIEAKVIRTDGAVSKYVSEITDNFLTRRYSTFSSEAAILGYLLSGSSKKTFAAISKSLKCSLQPYRPFPKKDHQYSDHDRAARGGSGVSEAFRCHHMIMLFADSLKAGGSP